MPIRVALTFVALVAGIVSASAVPEIGKPGHIKDDDALACPSVEIVSKVMSIGQSDPSQGMRYAVSKGCVLLSEGSQIVVEDLSANGLACVRAKGKPACLWMNQTQVASD
ncbi:MULTISPECIES: hypothetical protein [unclassified Bradyrhizobium]|uniref:hypothetical protein n=1 Tax=unclassified Bradyrhizobium TaxID=2631580 RepID=UPI0028F1459B|nr:MULTISPECIES: hypothetical protein [unclassified Bradyrhizobium]